jgi:hypothetical protein
MQKFKQNLIMRIIAPSITERLQEECNYQLCEKTELYLD